MTRLLIRRVALGPLLALGLCCGSGASRIDGGSDAGAGTTGSAGRLGGGGAGSAGTRVDAAPDGPADASAVDGAGADAAHEDAGLGGAPDGPADASIVFTAGSPRRALAIATGQLHSCAILDDHRVKCWGFNFYGQLGLGDAVNRGAIAAELGDALPFVDLGAGRTAVAIAAGRYTSCAVLDDGRVKCWGMLQRGMVGDEPGEMGDALAAVDLGVGRKATHLATGYAYSCAALDDGAVKCWGDHAPTTVELGAVPTNAKVRQIAPARLGVQVLFEDGVVAGNVPASASPALFSDQKGVYVAGAEGRAAIVLTTGELLFPGDSSGNLPPATVTDAVAVGLGQLNRYTCGLFKGGGVRCWNVSNACPGTAAGATYWCPQPRNADGSFTVALGQPAVALGTSAATHECALLADGSVKCWDTSAPGAPAAGAGAALLGGASVTVSGTGAVEWRPVDFGKH